MTSDGTQVAQPAIDLAGLVRREPSTDDARVVYLCLTPEGERRFANAFRSLAAERRALREAIADIQD